MIYIAFMGGGGAGGGGGLLTIYTGETGSPSPVDTVMGPAKDARDLFLTKVTVNSPLTWEELYLGEDVAGSALLNGGVLNSTAYIISNGNTATLTSTSTDRAGSIRGAPFGGRFNTTTGGNNYADLDDTQTFKLAFTSNMAGFGCYLTDPGDFSSQWYAYVVDQNDVQTIHTIPHAVNGSNGNLVFWGFLDTSGLLYKSVELKTTASAGDAMGIDDLHFISSAQLVT